MLFLAIFIVGCSGQKSEMVDLSDRKKIHDMRISNFSTLISDSGIIRYKISAAEFYAYGRDTAPYWYFPEKIHVEQFDSLFRIEVSIDADTAYYYRDQDLWKAIGNVRVKNLDGQYLETSLLYWDMERKLVYTDKYFRITKGDFINTGMGFEADQMLTEFKIFNPYAEIPVDENNPDSLQAIPPSAP